MKIKFNHGYNDIISVENLLEAWSELLRGKRSRKDVQEFSLHLMDNIFSLYENLSNHTYRHGSYQAFNISDPKPRNIHKATVRDRLLHRAVYRKLYLFFDRKFVSDSYSCRNRKGTHRAINRFCSFAYKASKNNTKTCWVLKCDIKKFFASIDHGVLIDILDIDIADQNIINLLRKIVSSFETEKRKGLPLGNLTSQLFANIYMNELDQFVKHKLKAKYYIRYADDFVLLSENREWLKNCIHEIGDFLESKLKLELHPEKVFIKTVASGVDFLGWVHFSDHSVLRTSTKRRMLKRVKMGADIEIINSYLGLLKYGNSCKLTEEVGKIQKNGVE